jgi:predicted branched-subunit amino acid permease
MGAAVTLWFVWLLAIAVGATIGARVPEGLHLEMIIPLFLVGEVVHRVRDRATTSAAALATLAAIAAAPTPMDLGPIIAIAVGVAAGLRAERRAS